MAARLPNSMTLPTYLAPILEYVLRNDGVWSDGMSGNGRRQELRLCQERLFEHSSSESRKCPTSIIVGGRMVKKTKTMPQPDKKTLQAKRREICDFARDNNMVIHPGRGYDYSIESFFMFACCPCAPARKHCPCPESIKEVEVTGHCLCRLYWKSLDIFKEEMIKEID